MADPQVHRCQAFGDFVVIVYENRRFCIVGISTADRIEVLADLKLNQDGILRFDRDNDDEMVRSSTGWFLKLCHDELSEEAKRGQL